MALKIACVANSWTLWSVAVANTSSAYKIVKDAWAPLMDCDSCNKGYQLVSTCACPTAEVITEIKLAGSPVIVSKTVLVGICDGCHSDQAFDSNEFDMVTDMLWFEAEANDVD